MFNGNTDLSYSAFDLDGFSIDAHGFFVLGNAGVVNVDLVLPNPDNNIQNGPDAVALFQANAIDFPLGTAVTNVDLIDALVYDTDDGDAPGLIAVLTPGQAQIDEDGGSNKDGHSNSRIPDGGPARDTSTYVQQTPTPGYFNLTQPAPEIVINEVDADTPGTDTLEFVELYGEPNQPLDSLVVVLFNGNTDVSYSAFDLDGYATDAYGFFVLGNAGVTNVDLVFPDPDNNIQNGADAVALFQANAADFPLGTAVTNVDLIDALVYDTDDPDDLGLIAVLTPGQAQINEDGGGNKDGHSNSRVPDGGPARDTSTYRQQPPTPGPPINICALGIDLAIPDFNPTGVTNTLISGYTGRLVDLDVQVTIDHDWVGDLIVRLEHLDTAASIALIDRPGVPSSTIGCSSNDIDVILDDEGTADAESTCNAGPALDGNLIPNELLILFDGEDVFGDWRLTVSDNAGSDTGTLRAWCLKPTFDPIFDSGFEGE